MLSFGWPELLLIGVVILLIVGPQDIPKIMYGFGKAVQRLSYIKYIFTQRFDDFMQEAELKHLQDNAAKRAPVKESDGGKDKSHKEMGDE